MLHYPPPLTPHRDRYPLTSRRDMSNNLSAMAMSNKKRKHYEDVQVDPRYGGLVEYSSRPLRGDERSVSIGSGAHDAKRHRRPEHAEPRPQSRNQEIDSDGDLSDTGAELGETETDPRIHDVSHAFNDLNASLSNLLALINPGPGDCSRILDSVIGKDRASFVRAMKAMEREGSLSWLCNPRQPPTPEPATRIAQSKRSFSNGSNATFASDKTSQTRSSLKRGSPEPVPNPQETKNKKQRTVSFELPESDSTTETKAATSWPPPLPKIQNKDILRQVFTHKSVVDGATSQIDAANKHNERLEFLGDSLLGSLITKLIFKRFPNLREGPMTTLRSSCVSNKTLHGFAELYHFESKLISDNKERINVLIKNPKILADVFEAYIGGLSIDTPDGEEKVNAWLHELYAPKFAEYAEAQNTLKPLDKSAKNTLQSIVGGKNVKIDYQWVGGKGGGNGGYEIAIVFTGWGLEQVELARGTGTNKTDASLRAAMNLLDEGATVAMIRKAKQVWYETQSEAASETGTAIRHVLS